MKKYGIVDSGPINPESEREMYNLQDPTWKHLAQARRHLRKRLINEPKRNFLIFYIFACHGIQVEGKQSVICNEFDKKTRYYHLYGAEHELRLWSSKHSNSYLIGIFACCREIFNKLRHSGCYGGTEKEALQAHAEKLNKKYRDELIKSTEN